MLVDAGINTDKFKSHSARAAATSAAKDLEVPIDHILAAAGWASERMFHKYYHKEIAEPEFQSWVA